MNSATVQESNATGHCIAVLGAGYRGRKLVRNYHARSARW